MPCLEFHSKTERVPRTEPRSPDTQSLSWGIGTGRKLIPLPTRIASYFRALTIFLSTCCFSLSLTRTELARGSHFWSTWNTFHFSELSLLFSCMSFDFDGDQKNIYQIFHSIPLRVHMALQSLRHDLCSQQLKIMTSGIIFHRFYIKWD